MSRSAWLAALALVLSGCPEKVLKKELPKIDFSSLPLPKSADGKLILIEASTARLEIDPSASDAITAVGACTDLVALCAAGDALDLCVQNARECQTSRPWEERDACCPAACKKSYESARKSLGPIDAFEQSFFLQPDCFPGLKSALEGNP